MIGRLRDKSHKIGNNMLYNVEDLKTAEITGISVNYIKEQIKNNSLFLINASIDKGGRLRKRQIKQAHIDNIRHKLNLLDTDTFKGCVLDYIEYMLRDLKVEHLSFETNIGRILVLNNEIIYIHPKLIGIVSKFLLLDEESSIENIEDFIRCIYGYNTCKQKLTLVDIIKELTVKHPEVKVDYDIAKDKIKIGDVHIKVKIKPGVYKIKTPKTKGEFIKIKTVKELTKLI